MPHEILRRKRNGLDTVKKQSSPEGLLEFSVWQTCGAAPDILRQPVATPRLAH